MSKILYDRLIIINARLRELQKNKLNVKLLKEKIDLREENTKNTLGLAPQFFI
jgi:hypothetical protein